MLLERVTEQGIVSSFIDTIEFTPDNWVISSVGLNNTCYNLCVVVGLTAFTPMPPFYTVLGLLRILYYFTMMRRVVLVVEKLKWFYSGEKITLQRCLLYEICTHCNCWSPRCWLTQGSGDPLRRLYPIQYFYDFVRQCYVSKTTLYLYWIVKGE